MNKQKLPFQRKNSIFCSKTAVIPLDTVRSEDRIAEEDWPRTTGADSERFREAS